MGKAGGHGRAAARGDGISQLERRNRARHLKGDIDAIAGEASDFADGVVRAGVDRVTCAEFRREGELLVRKIDGDDLARASEPCAEHDAQAHAAQAHHRDRLARFDLGGVDDRADPGQHRAAEQSGQFKRQVGVDLDAGFARHHCVGRKARDAEQVVHRLGVKGKPPLAGKQRSSGVGLRRRLAKRGTSRHAGVAVAAACDEHQHHVVADRKIGHPVADRLDNSRRLVAERHRRRARP